MIKPGAMLKQLNQLVFSILLVGCKKENPAKRRTSRVHPYYSFWLVSKGSGEFLLNGEAYTAEPGKLFVILPGTVVLRRSEVDDPVEFYFIRFSAATAYESSEHWTLMPPEQSEFPLFGPYTIHNPPKLLNLFEQLHLLSQRRGQTITMRKNILFHEILIALADDFRSQIAAGSTTMSIETTIDYMIHHYKSELKLEQLAGMAGLSVSHYSRLFRKYMGYSPIDYLTHVRMDRAKELLAVSDYRLKNIAESVGYHDEFYFSRLFKKIVGISPSEYAKDHRSLSGAPDE